MVLEFAPENSTAPRQSALRYLGIAERIESRWESRVAPKIAAFVSGSTNEALRESHRRAVHAAKKRSAQQWHRPSGMDRWIREKEELETAAIQPSWRDSPPERALPRSLRVKMGFTGRALDSRGVGADVEELVLFPQADGPQMSRIDYAPNSAPLGPASELPRLDSPPLLPFPTAKCVRELFHFLRVLSISLANNQSHVELASSVKTLRRLAEELSACRSLTVAASFIPSSRSSLSPNSYPSLSPVATRPRSALSSRGGGGGASSPLTSPGVRPKSAVASSRASPASSSSGAPAADAERKPMTFSRVDPDELAKSYKSRSLRLNEERKQLVGELRREARGKVAADPVLKYSPDEDLSRNPKKFLLEGVAVKNRPWSAGASPHPPSYAFSHPVKFRLQSLCPDVPSAQQLLRDLSDALSTSRLAPALPLALTLDLRSNGLNDAVTCGEGGAATAAALRAILLHPSVVSVDLRDNGFPAGVEEAFFAEERDAAVEEPTQEGEREGSESDKLFRVIEERDKLRKSAGSPQLQVIIRSSGDISTRRSPIKGWVESPRLPAPSPPGRNEAAACPELVSNILPSFDVLIGTLLIDKKGDKVFDRDSKLQPKRLPVPRSSYLFTASD